MSKLLISRNQIQPNSGNFCTISSTTVSLLQAFPSDFSLEETIYGQKCECTEASNFYIFGSEPETILSSKCECAEALNFTVNYAPREKIKSLYFCAASFSNYLELDWTQTESIEEINFCKADFLDYFVIL